MHKSLTDITGVLLVGGKSRRMGQDKAFLAVEGVPVIDRLVLVMQDCFSRLLLVGDRPERFADHQLQVVPDIYPGSSLGGLYTGLCQAETDRIFVSSCDIPFPSQALIRLICAESGPYDAVVPTTVGGLEPLFALYHKSALPAMQVALESGQYRINNVLKDLNIRLIGPELLEQIDPGGRALLNINTPQEYAACRLET